MIRGLVCGSDAWSKIVIVRVVQPSVRRTVEHERSWNVETNGAADRIDCGGIKILLRIRALGRGRLNFIAQAKIERQARLDFPGVLHIPAEQMLVGRRELRVARLIRSTSHAQQKRCETVTG